MQDKATLIPLEVHNSLRREALSPDMNRPNGLACPQCNAELRDTVPGRSDMTVPPSTPVNCAKCGFTGTRIL